jgi:chemotaxis protein MotB
MNRLARPGPPPRPSPRRAGEADGDGADGWMVSFADLVTLLLAFFVAIAATGGVDQPALERLVAGFTANVGLGSGAAIERDGHDLATELRTTLADLPFGRNASIGEGAGTVTVALPADVLFAHAAADLDPEAIAILRAVADVLNGADYVRWAVEVEGHTDDARVTTARFPSNWELSAARATNVLRLLEAFGVLPARLKAVAYGETRPARPNRDAAGIPVPANQAANRRIVIVVMR